MVYELTPRAKTANTCHGLPTEKSKLQIYNNKMNQFESRIPTFPSSKTTLILKNPLTTRNSNTEVPQRTTEKEQINSKPKLILNPATTEKKKQVPITPSHSFNYTRKDFTIVKQKMEELQAENENLKVERAQNLLKIRQLEKKLNQEKEEKEKLHKGMFRATNLNFDDS